MPSFSDRVKQKEELRPLNMQLDEIKTQLTANHQPHQQQIEYKILMLNILETYIYITLIGDEINVNTKQI